MDLHRFDVFSFWVLGIFGRNFKNTEKVQSIFNLIYTLLICFDIQTTNKKKTKTIEKTKKTHKPRENQKNAKTKKTKKQKTKALTETQTSPRIFCFSSGFFGFVGVLKLRRYQRMQPKHLARIDGRHVHKWKECGRNTVSLCLTIPIGKNIYVYIYIYRSQTPKNTRAHSTPFWYLMVKVVTHSGLGHWRSWSILYISFGPGNEIASSLLVIKLSTHQTWCTHGLIVHWCSTDLWTDVPTVWFWLMFHCVNWCALSLYVCALMFLCTDSWFGEAIGKCWHDDCWSLLLTIKILGHHILCFWSQWFGNLNLISDSMAIN